MWGNRDKELAVAHRRQEHFTSKNVEPIGLHVVDDLVHCFLRYGRSFLMFPHVPFYSLDDRWF
jgi:hypothetical protein